MLADAEGEVGTLATIDPERVGLCPAPGIAVGRSEDGGHHLALRDGHAIDLDIAGGLPGGGPHGRVEPERLLDDLADEGPVVHHSTVKLGLLQDLVRNEPYRVSGLVDPTGDHETDIVGDLIPAEAGIRVRGEPRGASVGVDRLEMSTEGLAQLTVSRGGYGRLPGLVLEVGQTGDGTIRRVAAR